MPIRTAIWKVATPPELLADASLPNERVLEEMIVAAPRLLSEEWMLIGRQEDTGRGGRIDLLAVAPDGAIVLIELKRDRTPCSSVVSPSRSPASISVCLTQFLNELSETPSPLAIWATLLFGEERTSRTASRLNSGG
jgi:hypothetical protein